MVDAAAALKAHSAPAARQATATPKVACAGAEGAAAYATLCAKAGYGPAQSPLWVETWITEAGADAMFVTIAEPGGVLVALALEVVRQRGITAARFMGGTHANGNLPATTGRRLLTLDDWAGVLAAIRAARPDIDLLQLERLAPELDGISNPLSELATGDSANPSLAVGLDGGFDAVLERSSAKRKRKKHRGQTRKFEAAGGFRRIEGTSEAEVDRLLDAFFVMKKARFAAMGIANVFADPQIQSFFRGLFKGALGAARPQFVLHGLEVAGQLRAVTGCSRLPHRLVCEFGSITEDELANASPGDFLFFENIREACAEGLAVYDFSVGDEGYKRLWCNLETRQFDIVAPLTAKGRLAAFAFGLTARAKRAIKRNETLWPLLRRLRRRAAAKTPREPSED